MDSKAILKKLDRIEDLPTLPVIALEINKMLQDQETSIKQLSQTIERDQAMVPKILKLVNSAFFGFQSKVGNIDRAIILLGFNAIQNAIVSISIINAFSGKKGFEGFDIKKFWIHAVSVAVTSKYLAEKNRYQSPSDAFTAGLLHDIGKLVLAQHFPDLFEKVWKSIRKDNHAFIDAEKKEIPITHVKIGTHLARQWRLPVSLIDVIRCHHAVRDKVADFDLLIIVHVADCIVNAFNADSGGKPDLSAIYPGALPLMETHLNTLADWFPEVGEEIESACRFFLDEID